MTNSNSLKKQIFFTQGMLFFLIGISLPIISVFFYRKENLYWSIPSSILPIVLGGYFLYYFEIDNEKLIVKNLIFFWIHKEYKKNQITDIRLFINYGTNDEGYEIITKHILIQTDNKSKKYLMDYNERYYMDLFYKLKTFKYKNNIFNGSPLNRKINTSPNENVQITFKHLKKKKYLIANNIKLTQNITTTKLNFKIFFGLGCLILLFIITIGIIDYDGNLFNFLKLLSIVNLSYIIPMLIGLFNLVLFFVTGEKVIVYNRKENTITYPCSNYNRKTITIPFNKFKFHKILNDSRGWSSYTLVTKDVSTPKNNLGIFNLYVGKFCDDFYSYIIWYMDKRRPLPPSKVFDPYRQIDYKERKAKKFLKPLYSSNIGTPEVTRKQQSERKKISSW